MPTSSGVPESLTPELHALPSPRHLQEYLTGSRHLHLGFFDRSDDPLPTALDRLVLRDARLLGRNSLVADIGCGLGGTTNLLAAQGHRVFGVDPCERSIDYARRSSTSPRAQFLSASLEAFAQRARGARFDAVFLIEVLGGLPDLKVALSACKGFLRPGGLILSYDTVRAVANPTGASARHARGAVRSAGDAAGFDLLESRDLTTRTSPTLPRLQRLLAERRDDVLRVFGSTRPAIHDELEAWQRELRELEFSFAHQELAFESNVLRNSARVASDSVVLRPQTRAVPAREPEA